MAQRLIIAAAATATFALLVFAGCGIAGLGAPPGERIGSVNGDFVVADTGNRTPFSLFVYREDSGDLRFYLTLPARNIRYGKIEDMSFEDGAVHFDLSTGRVVDGTVVMEGLEIEGSLEPWVRRFSLRL